MSVTNLLRLLSWCNRIQRAAVTSATWRRWALVGVVSSATGEFVKPTQVFEKIFETITDLLKNVYILEQ